MIFQYFSLFQLFLYFCCIKAILNKIIKQIRLNQQSKFSLKVQIASSFISVMFKGTPYSNKLIKKRQQQRLLQIHKQNLKGIRPLTNIDPDNPYDPTNVMINNKKKDMLQQDRFTQIQRQNRMLLQKINSIMSKKPSFRDSIQKVKRKQSITALGDKARMNKSLNQGFRRKQLEGIEIQNAKLLKRLQDKKSDYQAKKLKQQWIEQKKVIKNLVNYPFIIRDRIFKGRKKSSTSQSFHGMSGYPYTPNPTNLTAPIQLVRIRNLNGHNFLLTIKFDNQNGLHIMGDNKSTKQIKLIQIPKQQAIQFIQYECDGKIELLFECLKFDEAANVLYLVGKDVDIGVREKENQQDQDNQQGKKQNKIEMNVKSQQEDQRLENEGKQFQKSKNTNNNNLSYIQEQQGQYSHLKTENHRITEMNILTTEQKDKPNQILHNQQQKQNNIKIIHEENRPNQQSKEEQQKEQKLKEQQQPVEANIPEEKKQDNPQRLQQKGAEPLKMQNI